MPLITKVLQPSKLTAQHLVKITTSYVDSKPSGLILNELDLNQHLLDTLVAEGILGTEAEATE